MGQGPRSVSIEWFLENEYCFFVLVTDNSLAFNGCIGRECMVCSHHVNITLKFIRRDDVMLKRKRYETSSVFKFLFFSKSLFEIQCYRRLLLTLLEWFFGELACLS